MGYEDLGDPLGRDLVPRCRLVSAFDERQLRARTGQAPSTARVLQACPQSVRDYFPQPTTFASCLDAQCPQKVVRQVKGSTHNHIITY